MGKRQETALKTRKKLLETGEKLIRERGFDSVSVEDITTACGVAKGTFYTYFKRKEDIVQELSFREFGEIAERTKAMHGTFLEKLTYYAVHFSAHIENAGVKMAQQWTKNVIDPTSDICAEYSKLDYDTKTLFDIFAFSVQNRELSADIPVAEFVDLLNAQLYGLMVCWCMSDGNYSLTARTEQFCRFALRRLFEPYLVNIDHHGGNQV